MSQQILSPEELMQLEERCANKLGEGELMRRAGAAVAATVRTLAEPGSHVVIICGPGNNGGDGFACALSLKAMGFRVTCALIGCREPKTDEARAMFNAWVAAGGSVIEDPYSADKADVVVDALFGTGLKKALSGDFLDAAMWFNERQAAHVSIDIPSGLDAQTGNWVGGMKGCIADITIAMLCPKAGCYMNDGADASGRILLEELDVSVPLSTLGVIDTDDFRHVLEPRARNSHKGTYGHVAVVGGESGFVGAALLAGRAALKLGAGRVTVELLAKNAPAVDPVCPELMLAAEPIDLTKTDCNVVGCGIGFSEKAKERVMAAIAAPVPLILDADALRMIAQDQKMIEAMVVRQAHTVITPHPGEAAEILDSNVKAVNADRVQAARELSILTGAISVLKGCGSVIALRSSRTWINPTGNASLATAGSGDVLSGMLGAMFAQQYDLVSAVLSAVWLHGRAAEDCYAGMTASDIAPAAADILDALRGGDVEDVED